jgi:hypothetical protein
MAFATGCRRWGRPDIQGVRQSYLEMNTNMTSRSQTGFSGTVRQFLALSVQLTTPFTETARAFQGTYES